MAIGMEVDSPCDITRNPHEQNSSLHFEQQLTNFSIAEILKPDFGRKRLSACANANYGYPADQRCSDSSADTDSETSSHSHSPSPTDSDEKQAWPAWVYCTRYSDRPASGPRSRKSKKKEKTHEEKRPRTAFTNEQLQKLKQEFDDNRYLTESRRQDLARDLNLNESQIKIWFQNKRAKLKKSSGGKHSLAEQLSAQGLYNHAMTSEQSVDSMS